MDNFNLVTPEEYIKSGNDSRNLSLEKLRKIANKKAKPCIVCGQPEWKLVEQGMCFSCTTGESDSSDDYELIPSKD